MKSFEIFNSINKCRSCSSKQITKIFSLGHQCFGGIFPLSKRQNRPDAVTWLLKNYPQLSDGQIGKLVGSTKNTVTLIRNKNYWNSSNLSPKDPVVSNLCSQIDIKNAVDKADRRVARNKKELEKQNKKIED